MSKSKIEWTDATWNPCTGCTKVSQGCKNCYAETWANRKMGNFAGDRKFTDIICHEDRLKIPLHWKKPKKIFVNSMSDLFHEQVPFEFINNVYDVMARCSQHTFQILTKRPERMKEYMDGYFVGIVNLHKGDVLPNVWLGVSCEDQKTADERIPILLQTPAAVRFISAEPLLGEINLKRLSGRGIIDCLEGRFGIYEPDTPFSFGLSSYGTLNWVIVGGESGSKARPMHPDWVRKIRDDCKFAGVPFFFKQWGQWAFVRYVEDQVKFIKLGKHETGNFLDGKQYLEYPIN